MTGAAGAGAERPITRLKTLMERSILGLGMDAAARLPAAIVGAVRGEAVS